MFKRILEALQHPLQMFTIYLAMVATDFVSSLHTADGFGEGNPFARHADGSFWPAHALVDLSFEVLGLALLSAFCYVGGRVVERKWGRLLAGLPWIYFGYGHLDAALHSIMISMHLYVPVFKEMLLKRFF